MPDFDALCRLRVAFASPRHAQYALEFLESLADPSLRTWVESDASLTFIEIEVSVASRERVSTLMRGAHGILVEMAPLARIEVA